MAPTWALVLFSLDHLIGSLTAADTRSASLRPVPGQEISAFQAAVSSRDQLDCVTQCLKYSHCSSVAFLPSSKTCYLQPTSHVATAAEAVAVTVWEIEDAICTSVLNGDVVPVNRILTSMAGNVTCDADYIWSRGDGGAKCLSNETWTTEGVFAWCQQYHWINPVNNRYYRIPRTPSLTWKTCLRLRRNEISYNRQFQVRISSRYDVLLMADFHFFGSSTLTILTNVINGTWHINRKDIYGPAPSNDTQEYLVEISPASEHLFNINVDGEFVEDLATPVNVSRNILYTYIYANPSYSILDLNVLCSN